MAGATRSCSPASSRSWWRSACCSRSRLASAALALFAYATVDAVRAADQHLALPACPTSRWAPSSPTTTPSAPRSSPAACSSRSSGSVVFPILAFGVFLAGPTGRLNHAAYSPLAWTCARDRRGRRAAGRRRDLARPGPPARRRRPARSFTSAQFLGEAAEVLTQPLVPQPVLPLPDPVHRARVRRRADAARQHLLLEAASCQGLTTLGLVAPIGWLAGVFVAAMLARRMEKRNIAMLGLGLIGVAQVAPVPLKLAT